jgi:hypothetical protein
LSLFTFPSTIPVPTTPLLINWRRIIGLLLAFHLFRLTWRHAISLLLLLSPNLLLRNLLPPNLLGLRLKNAFLFSCLTGRHSILLLRSLLAKYLLRCLNLLPLPAAATAVAAAAISAAVTTAVLFLSWRAAVRITSAMTLALAESVLI